MTDDVEQDNSDFKGGYSSSWATMWQSVFFSLDLIVMLISLVLNLCLLRAMARNTMKETSVLYMWIVFLFFTSLVDDAVIIGSFMTLHGHLIHTTDVCRMTEFVYIGNKLLQAFSVLGLLYYAWFMLEFKSKAVENKVRTFMPFILLGLIVLEVMFTIPQTMNVKGSLHSQFCLYTNDSITTRRLTGWLYQVLFPYYIPLILSVLPVTKILLKLRQPDGVSDRDTGGYQIVLAAGVGYFFFHLLYYLLWLGREVEALALSKTDFTKLLGRHVWYITRPMFALINLGWHITTPLAPFVFDVDLADEFPGIYVNKARRSLTRSGNSESIILEERHQEREAEVTAVDGRRSEVNVDKQFNWTEIHNPLSPVDDGNYTQIPL